MINTFFQPIFHFLRVVRGTGGDCSFLSLVFWLLLKKLTASAGLSGGEAQVSPVNVRHTASTYGGNDFGRFFRAAFGTLDPLIPGGNSAHYFKFRAALFTLIFINRHTRLLRTSITFL
jgi:hypothetical protein